MLPVGYQLEQGLRSVLGWKALLEDIEIICIVYDKYPATVRFFAQPSVKDPQTI